MSAPFDANGDPLYLFMEVVLKSDGHKRGSVAMWIDDRHVRVEWPGGEQQDYESAELVKYEPRRR